MRSWKEITMSRIGKKPVAVPAGVKVAVDGRASSPSKARKGKLAVGASPGSAGDVRRSSRRQVVVTAPAATIAQSRAYHGLTRSLVQNMVVGVINGYEKRLEIVGVGYLGRRSRATRCRCASALPTNSTRRSPPDCRSPAPIRRTS